MFMNHFSQFVLDMFECAMDMFRKVIRTFVRYKTNEEAYTKPTLPLTRRIMPVSFFGEVSFKCFCLSL